MWMLMVIPIRYLFRAILIHFCSLYTLQGMISVKMFTLCCYSVCSSPLHPWGHTGLIFLLSAVLCTFFRSKFPRAEVPYALFENFFLKEPCDSSAALPSSLGVRRGHGVRWQEAPKVRLSEMKHTLQAWITSGCCSLQCYAGDALLPVLAVGFQYHQYHQHLAGQWLIENLIKFS